MTEEADQRGEMLRAFLAEHDEPCPGCGYNLRGLTGEACPECGEMLRLRVGMVEPRMGLFIAGLIGLATGTGLHGVLGLLALPQAMAAITNGWGRWHAVAFAVLYGGAVVCGGGLVVWVRARRRIRRVGAGARVFWVALCWLVPVVTIGWFFLLVV